MDRGIENKTRSSPSVRHYGRRYHQFTRTRNSVRPWNHRVRGVSFPSFDRTLSDFNWVVLLSQQDTDWGESTFDSSQRPDFFHRLLKKKKFNPHPSSSSPLLSCYVPRLGRTCVSTFQVPRTLQVHSNSLPTLFRINHRVPDHLGSVVLWGQSRIRLSVRSSPSYSPGVRLRVPSGRTGRPVVPVLGGSSKTRTTHQGGVCGSRGRRATRGSLTRS